MNILKTLVSAAAGTSFMTLYSYLRSGEQNEQFREPEILNRFIQRSLPDRIAGKSNGESGISGWLLHFGTGLVFSAVYDQIWSKTKTAPTIPKGLIMGGTAGLAGISIWYATFKLLPGPPEVDRNEYFKHLMAAHIVFGLFASLGYRTPADAIKD